MTYSSSVAHQYTALLTLPDRSRPPIEADTAYQECLPSCELHSRSLAVGGRGACNLEIAHAWFMQSRDCTHVLCNLKIAHVLCNLETAQSRDSVNAQHNLKIARLHETYIKGV